MARTFPHPLLEHAGELARFGGWSAEVYGDLLAIQAGRMEETAFRRKYCCTVAILQLDMTGMTETARRDGALRSFLRILNLHQVCAPVLLERGATHIRTFADDMTALFDQAGAALDAALAIHRRLADFNATLTERAQLVQCGIGLGYGEVFAIGLDRAMGDEINRAAKLGEDTAQGGETLLTERFYDRVRHRLDVRFEPRTHDELPFPFYSVSPS